MEIKNTTEAGAVQDARKKDETYHDGYNGDGYKSYTAIRSHYTSQDIRLAYAETDGGGK